MSSTLLLLLLLLPNTHRHPRLVVVEHLLQRHQRPLPLHDLPVRTDPAPPTEHLAVLELPLENSVVRKVGLPPPVHLPVLHLPLVPRPRHSHTGIRSGPEHAPAVRLVESPLALVLYLAVGKEKLSLPVHHIVPPPSLIVTPVLENVLPPPVFQVMLLLTDVLTPVCILLMHLNQLLLLLLLHRLPAPTKHTLRYRLRHPRRIRHLPVPTRVPRTHQILRMLVLDRAQPHIRPRQLRRRQRLGNDDLQVSKGGSFMRVELQHAGQQLVHQRPVSFTSNINKPPNLLAIDFLPSVVVEVVAR